MVLTVWLLDSWLEKTAALGMMWACGRAAQKVVEQLGYLGRRLRKTAMRTGDAQRSVKQLGLQRRVPTPTDQAQPEALGR